MTPNLPGTCPRARWSVTYGGHVAPKAFQLSTESRQQILSYFTLWGAPYPYSRGYEPEFFRQSSGFSSIFKCQHFPISERRQMVADSDPSRKRNIPIPYVRKSSTVE